MCNVLAIVLDKTVELVLSLGKVLMLWPSVLLFIPLPSCLGHCIAPNPRVCVVSGQGANPAAFRPSLHSFSVLHETPERAWCLG